MQRCDPSSAPTRILIIDDDEGIRNLCRSIAESVKLEPHTAANGAEGLERATALNPEYILLDIDLPDTSGIDLLLKVRQACPNSRVVMVTGYDSIDYAITAVKRGAYDYITKPFLPSRLLKALQVETPPPVAARPAPLRGFCDIIGVSNAMQQIYALIEKAARSDSTVLIEGESGTGKELVAKAIHQRSPRHREPFVPVDCGAISPSLIESELFGHMAGAYTDARTASIGLLRSAEGGTVFLDEIGELPPSVQVKLLRALQEMEVRPVGSSRSEPINARIIAATNRDLSQAVEKGRFRRDLFYRLHVIPLFVPPLRERREDVPLLVEHFMRSSSRSTGRCMYISPDALQQLMRYDWPGNVRELENSMHRAFALLEGDHIEGKDVPCFLQPRGISAGDTPPCTPPAPAANGSGNGMLADREEEAIRQAIQQANGNKRQAARLLGIGIATLYRKIKKYEIAPRPTQPSDVSF